MKRRSGLYWLEQPYVYLNEPSPQAFDPHRRRLALTLIIIPIVAIGLIASILGIKPPPVWDWCYQTIIRPIRQEELHEMPLDAKTNRETEAVPE